MVEICQLTIRGQLPNFAQAANPRAAENELLQSIKDHFHPASIRSNKRLGVKERGKDYFQLFAVEGSGNDTEILMESVTLCPESGGVNVNEIEDEIVLDVGRELSLVFKGKDARELLVTAAKLIHRRLCANPTLEGVSEYLQAVGMSKD